MSTIPTEPPADAGDFENLTPEDPLRAALDGEPAGLTPEEREALDGGEAPEPEDLDTDAEPEADEGTSSRTYLIFVKAGDADWTEAGSVEATTRAHAEQSAFDNSPAIKEAAQRPEGVTLVACPARYWNPRTPKTRVTETTDWS